MKTISGVFASFILCALSGNVHIVDPDKQALRYGFQKTDCESFEKSFICIRKCLDLGYDVAVADKNCKCRCFKKEDKAKYSSYAPGKTNWKAGAPTTKVPQWAQTQRDKKKEGELNTTAFSDEREVLVHNVDRLPHENTTGNGNDTESAEHESENESEHVTEHATEHESEHESEHKSEHESEHEKEETLEKDNISPEPDVTTTESKTVQGHEESLGEAESEVVKK